MTDKIICYIHIEKAGGTTFHNILRNNYLTYMPLKPWHYWTNEESNLFTAKEAEKLFKYIPFAKGFGGHTVRSYLGYEELLNRKIFYITFLREPISRYISHYRYQKNVMKIDWDFNEFLREKRFSNFMTKKIAGCYDINKAKDILKNKISFVGILEHYDESLVLLKQKMNDDSFDIHYLKARKSKKLDDELNFDYYTEKIVENNKLDIELYNFALDNIFNKQKKKYGLNFESDVVQFKKENVQYHYHRNILSKIAGIYFRKFYTRLESKVHGKYHDNIIEF